MYQYFADEAIMFRINQSIVEDCEAGNLSAYDFVLSLWQRYKCVNKYFPVLCLHYTVEQTTPSVVAMQVELIAQKHE